MLFTWILGILKELLMHFRGLCLKSSQRVSGVFKTVPSVFQGPLGGLTMFLDGSWSLFF